MDSLKKFPYEDVEEVIYFEDMKGENYKNQQKSEVQLYRRFPWIQFKNDEFKKKYIYLGRETQKSHPFYIRFDLREESSEGLINAVNERMEIVVDSITNPSSQDNKLKKAIQENKKKITSSYYHAYLLTGIAKPNIRVNQIYESLFVEVLRPKQALIQDRNDRKGLYNMLKLSWEYKFHSYEYFMFMSKAYSIIYDQFAKQNVPQDQIDDLTSMELYNFNQARTIKYFNKEGKEKQIRDLEYYRYFSNIFKQYNKQILQMKPQSQMHPKKYILMIGEKEHFLHQFDFRSYFEQQFKGKQLSPQSLQKMVNHNHQRNQSIINTFPFKTRNSKISLLKKTIDQSKKVNEIGYNSLKLLAIRQTQTMNHCIQQDQNYMILQIHEEQCNGLSVCFKDVIDKMIIKQEQAGGNLTLPQSLQKPKETMFYHIYRTRKWGSKCQLLKNQSFNPTNLTCEEDGNIFPLFENSLIRTLQLDKLPLTLQQQLLTCTPLAQINIYQQLQKLIKQYRVCVNDKKALHKFCYSLSDDKEDGFKLHPEDSQQVNRQKEDLIEQRDNKNEQDLQLRVNILLMSMIELQNMGVRCLSSEMDKFVPFNALTPTHYKELHQNLAMLFITTNIVNNICCTIKGVELQNLLNGEPHQITAKIHSNNLGKIKSIKDSYIRNLNQYTKFVAYNQSRSYFRLIRQNLFHVMFLNLFQKLQNDNILQKCLHQIMRVMKKSFIAIEFLETRVALRKIGQKDQFHKLMMSQYLQGLEVFRKTVEDISMESRKDINRSELSDSNWKTINENYYKELRAAVSTINKEFTQYKEILKMGPLKSEEAKKAMGKQDLATLQRKIVLLKQSNLIIFCSVYRNLLKLQVQEIKSMALLYKILLCFSSHLGQLHPYGLLRHQPNKVTTLQAITSKTCQLKSAMLTQLITYISNSKQKYST